MAEDYCSTWRWRVAHTAPGTRMNRRQLLTRLGGIVWWPLLRGLGLGSALAGCAAGAGGAKGGSGLEVKKSWLILLGDSPTYADRLAWAPDSRRLAIGSVSDKRMSVWDARDVRRLPGPENQAGGVQGLAYSPDGRYLAVARGSGGPDKVTIRDPLSGALIQGLVADPSELKLPSPSSVAFSPDSRYLAVAYLIPTALYTREGGEWRRTGGLGPGAHQVAFSPDGSSVVLYGAGSPPPRIFLCRVPSMEVLRSWPPVGGPDFGYGTLAYRPSGGQIAAGRGPELSIFEPDQERLQRSIRFRAISGLAYSADGRYLAVADTVTINLVDSESWAEVSVLAAGPRRQVHQIAFSPDGAMLAAATGPEVRIWEFSR